jgi:hypothetical protein
MFVVAVMPRQLFDHRVGGGQQRLRNGETERLRGLEIDDEIEFGGLQDRKVGGLFAFQNTPNIDANAGAGARPGPGRYDCSFTA